MWSMSSSRRRRGAVALLLLLLTVAGRATAQEASESDGRTRDQLWEPTAPIAFALRFDRRAVFGDRDTTSTKEYPATLTWSDSTGAARAMPVRLRTRGHFRRLSRNCTTPPLRLLFDKAEVKGTPFTGQRTLKLVTACRSGEKYDEYVRREYAVYRVHRQLTDWSFGARLATVTYVDSARDGQTEVRPGMLLERDDDVGARHGTKVWGSKGTPRMSDTEPDLTALTALFLYFVGNTDWSLPAQHNITLFSDTTLTLYPAAYDFDWSGIVDTDYAFPDSRLPIRSVRERLYRGPCRSPEDFAPAFARFRTQRPAIEAVYTGESGLSPAYVRATLKYIDDFYRTLENAGRWRAEMERSCVKDR